LTTTILKRNGIATSLHLDKLHKVAEFACKGLEEEGYTADRLVKEVAIQLKDNMTTRQIQRTLVQTAVELTSISEPNWQYVASRLLAYDAYKEAALNRGYNHFGYGNFYELLQELTDKGLYGSYIIEGFSKDEIQELGRYIVPERDYLLNYSGLKLLLDRYVIRGFNRDILELPQEMFMGIAMHLSLVEKNAENKMKWAKKYYDLASTLRFTFATPTMSGARKVHHQLSSCFIDTVGDSLKGIYASTTNFAEVSKNGGGMGLYYGKVRGRGSDIRGYKNTSSGIIPWIRLANDTSVSVDQLGQRSGSVSVWTDCWHIDLLEFLKLKTNSGDDRAKAHDVFPGICFSDLFWRMAGDDMEEIWYLFCPHEIEKEMGFRLEDAWGEEWEIKYSQCIQNKRLRRQEVKIKDIVKLVITSQLETGTPFVMNRDSVNRMNPNGHAGIIRSSNLCTEILQNMNEQQFVEHTIKTENGDDIIVTEVKAGDFVVCNLSSTVVSRNLTNEQLEESVNAQMRAMDAVIDLNEYPLPNAAVTNKKYRAVGLGSMGYHHALALQGIRWESEEHLEWADQYYEKLSFYTIKASMELAKERGAYPLFEGSDWHTGAYFDKRGLKTVSGGLDWDGLREKVRVHGVRNAYMMAVAPNGSTSVIAGTSASIDPIMDKYWLEEKKGLTVPQTAPDLDKDTFWLYKEAHRTDQMYSIRANSVRQKYIDQGQSFNLYIDPDQVTLRTIFNYYYEAWRLGVKTVYYVRSKSLEIEECVSCSA
jgi:ribonucleoside-diphosphate reductase alpha chain